MLQKFCSRHYQFCAAEILQPSNLLGAKEILWPSNLLGDAEIQQLSNLLVVAAEILRPSYLLGAAGCNSNVLVGCCGEYQPEVLTVRTEQDQGPTSSKYSPEQTWLIRVFYTKPILSQYKPFMRLILLKTWASKLKKKKPKIYIKFKKTIKVADFTPNY